MRRASREKKLERLSVWVESNSNIQEKEAARRGEGAAEPGAAWGAAEASLYCTFISNSARSEDEAREMPHEYIRHQPDLLLLLALSAWPDFSPTRS